MFRRATGRWPGRRSAPGDVLTPQGAALAFGAPLSLEHQPEIDTALSALAHGHGEHALSDLSFANLYLFRRAHGYRYQPGPLPCISGHTYDGTRHLLPLFELASAGPDDLAALLQGHDCFFPVAQAQIDTLDAERFEWTASRNDADYLYPAANFRHYRGAVLAKKRNLVKQLLAAHLVTAEPYDPHRIDAALAVLSGWMKAKAKAAGEADETPCTEALQLAPTLGLHGFLYRAGGAPAGFVLAQPMQPGVWVMRFAKGLDRFKGIYQYMFQHFCASLPDLHWLNFEQDMGMANFRRSKLSYQPSALIPKFRVRQRPR
jgi:uncharacterized protein